MEVFVGRKYCTLGDKQILYNIGIREDDKPLISKPEQIYWTVLLCLYIKNMFRGPGSKK